MTRLSFLSLVCAVALLAACDTDLYGDTGACRDDDWNTACPVDGDRDGTPPADQRPTATNVFSLYPAPEDWQWLALYGNWDFVEPETWRAIVMRPECDKATALAIFWKLQPDYYLRFANRDAVDAVNRTDYDLMILIRDRWKAGAYTRSAFAFDPDVVAGSIDLDELRRQYGDRVDALNLPAMRVRLVGRGIARAR